MWQGREIVLCALAFLAGNLLGGTLTLAPVVYLGLAALVSLLAAACAGSSGCGFPVGMPLISLPLLLFCFVLLGAAGVQVGRMPSFDGGSALQAWCLERKATFSAWMSGILPEGDELGVLRALAIGDKGGLARDLREAYRLSGAMHLLALSGLHVGLIYALLVELSAPLGGLRPMRVARSLLVLSALWAYALITGFSASIARAVLMITFYEISGFISGDRDGLSALAGSAMLLTLFRPESPRDIGFQLSYTAVLSILLLHPRLKGMLHTRSRLLSRIWELLSVSLCCQATCGVLAWIYFGSFPRYFLLTTLLAIPLATVVMYAIAASVASAGLSSLITHLLAPAGNPVPGDATGFSAASWLTAIFDALSSASSAILTWLLHLLNTVIRLIASL